MTARAACAKQAAMSKTPLIAAMSVLLSASAALAGGPFRHVVFFKFKDSAKPEQIREIEKAFAELPSKIDTIVSRRLPRGRTSRWKDLRPS